MGVSFYVVGLYNLDSRFFTMAQILLSIGCVPLFTLLLSKVSCESKNPIGAMAAIGVYFYLLSLLSYWMVGN